MILNRVYDNDFLYEDLSQLVNPEFKAWYMKVFYELDKERVLELAGIASADGKDPKKLFSYLLKRELIKGDSSSPDLNHIEKGHK